jgi:hypothetical protein
MIIEILSAGQAWLLCKNLQQYSGITREQFETLFNYYDEMADATLEDREFDPIGWVGDFSHYPSFEAAAVEFRSHYLEDVGNLLTCPDGSVWARCDV